MFLSMKNNVQLINPLNVENWNELLLSHPEYSFFHTSNWAKVLIETYNYSPQYLAAYNSDKSLSSLIAFMEIASFLTGRRGVSLPFSDYCEPICEDNFTDLFDEVMEIGRKKKWKSIEFRGGDKFFHDIEPSSYYYHHKLDLTRGQEEIFAGFSSNNKRNIKKAQRENVKIDFLNTREATDKFYLLNCITRKKHGLPPQPYSFFINIYKYILAQDLGFIVLASHENRVIASAVYLHFGSKALYKFGASDTSFQLVRPNNLIMWEAIKYFIDKGFSEFSFGKTEPENTGLRQFKLGWGTKEDKIFTYKYNLAENKFIANPDQTSGIHTKIFSKLPIPLLKLVGALTYRHIG